MAQAVAQKQEHSDQRASVLILKVLKPYEICQDMHRCCSRAEKGSFSHFLPYNWRLSKTFGSFPYSSISSSLCFFPTPIFFVFVFLKLRFHCLVSRGEHIEEKLLTSPSLYLLC